MLNSSCKKTHLKIHLVAVLELSIILHDLHEQMEFASGHGIANVLNFHFSEHVEVFDIQPSPLTLGKK